MFADWRSRVVWVWDTVDLNPAPSNWSNPPINLLTKAELEEEISLEVPGETAMDRLGNLAAEHRPTMVQPVNIPRSLSRRYTLDWGLAFVYNPH